MATHAGAAARRLGVQRRHAAALRTCVCVKPATPDAEKLRATPTSAHPPCSLRSGCGRATGWWVWGRGGGLRARLVRVRLFSFRFSFLFCDFLPAPPRSAFVPRSRSLFSMYYVYVIDIDKNKKNPRSLVLLLLLLGPIAPPPPPVHVCALCLCTCYKHKRITIAHQSSTLNAHGSSRTRVAGKSLHWTLALWTVSTGRPHGAHTYGRAARHGHAPPCRGAI